MSEKSPGLTVLIPTFNRAAVLRETLEALTRVERSGIDCEIVVIDNNSTDDTGDIARSFESRLPLTLLRETRPGKNCALNQALKACSLREIVVFTDDDVTPRPDWFRTILAAAAQWPAVDVFGGRVEIQWPGDRQPEWAGAEWIRAFGYSWHHYSDSEKYYQPPACPFGPNYWVRRAVFQKVPRFDESIGPRPKDRVMGSETSYLMELHRAGFKMLYYPAAVVQHRILEKECRIPALRRRGYTFGRGEVRLHGLRRRQLRVRSELLWRCALAADYVWTGMRFVMGWLHRNPTTNCEMTVNAMIRFGQLYETRRLACERRGSSGGSPDPRATVG